LSRGPSKKDGSLEKKDSPAIVAMPVPILWPQTTIFSIRKATKTMGHRKYQQKRKESGIWNRKRNGNNAEFGDEKK
jgi:hypothetical protein